MLRLIPMTTIAFLGGLNAAASAPSETLVPAASAPGEPLVCAYPVTLETVPLRRPLVQAKGAPPRTSAGPQVLAIFDEQGPVALGAALDNDPTGTLFIVRDALRDGAEAGVARAWIVAAEPTRTQLDLWPAEAEHFAQLDGVGPGQRSAWIAAGRRQGVEVGQAWWLRLDGQPAARFDVLHVAEEVCFVGVVSLLADLELRNGQRVARWPGPGQARDGAVATAVSYVSREGGERVAWAPAPRGVALTEEPHATFVRRGETLGYGVVQRQDERFWYLSFRGLTPGAEPLVGDVLRVRTLRDVLERRFTARVFETAPSGAAIDAGESDRLSFGEAGVAWRGEARLGTVRLTQVQRAYSLIEPAPEEGAAPFALRIGDEVRFWPPPPPPTPIGAVEAASGSLATIRFQRAPPSVPLAIVDSRGATVGVALLLDRVGSLAWAYVPPASLSAPLASGYVVVALPPAAGTTQPAAAPAQMPP
jgi:hypothetical protein